MPSGPTTSAPVAQPGHRPPSWRAVVLLAAFTALVAAPYLVGVLLPFYANDLDEVPLTELAGGEHDPVALWPEGTAGAWVQQAAFASLVITPLGLMGGLVGAVAGLLAGLPGSGRRPMSVPVAGGLALVSLVCVAGLAFLLSPLGAAITSWRMD